MFTGDSTSRQMNNARSTPQNGMQGMSKAKSFAASLNPTAFRRQYVVNGAWDIFNGLHAVAYLESSNEQKRARPTFLRGGSVLLAAMLVSAAVSLINGCPPIFGISLAVILLLVCGLLIHRARLSNVPGPWMNKITGLQLAFYDLRCRRNYKILEWHQRYGPVVCISPNEVSIASLEGTRAIYGATQGWAKSNYFDHFTGYGQRSVFATKPYQEHREKRRFTSAFYQASTIYKLPELERFIYDRCRAVLGNVERSDGEVDVYSLTDWYALDIITYLVFGREHSTRSVDHACPERVIFKSLKKLQFAGPCRVRFPIVFSWLSRPLGRWIPCLRFLLADDELADWCQLRISEAMDDPFLCRSPSLLRQLLQQRCDRDGKLLDRTFVAAEVLDNINAAEATVAVTATYLIWLLSEHPYWQLKIREELSALPLQSNNFVSFSDINSRAPALEACLREAYRLYPASSGRSERIVPKGGYEASGVLLPEGAIATSSVLSLHRDEEYFPDPEEFAPERWLGADASTHKAREARLVPFGYGGRICLGKALATMEIKMLIAALYLEYKSTVTASSTPESMSQCSTHDAVPWALECVIRFRRVQSKKANEGGGFEREGHA